MDYDNEITEKKSKKIIKKKIAKKTKLNPQILKGDIKCSKKIDPDPDDKTDGSGDDIAMCNICNDNPQETRCEHCDESRICSDCSYRCKGCDQKNMCCLLR